MLAPWKESHDQLRQCIQKQRHHFVNKSSYSQSNGFSSSHVQMRELDHKEGWALKNWYFRLVVLENSLESPLDCKEIKPVNPKGNQPWIFTGRIDAEAEAIILWPPDEKSQLTGKDPDAEKDWGQEEKEVAEDEMVGEHHWLNELEFEQTLKDSGGQGRLACCSPWSHKEQNTALQLNNRWLNQRLCFRSIRGELYVGRIQIREESCHNTAFRPVMTKIRISLVALGMERVDQHWKRDLWELMRKWGRRNQNAPNFFVPMNEKWNEVKSLSCVRLFATSWTVAYQVPPSMGFSRQEYWSGLPLSSWPRDRTLVSCFAGRRFNLWATREA